MNVWSAGNPAIDEVFPLEMNGDDPGCEPMAVIERAGMPAVGWSHRGSKIRGPQHGRFKIVSIGYCPSLGEVKRKLGVWGTIPAGVWQKAFLEKFPTWSSRGSIGIPDNSWIDPNGGTNFPMISRDGQPGMCRVGGEQRDGYSENWLWLVQVVE